MLVLSLIALMAISAANAAYSSSGSRAGSRYGGAGSYSGYEPYAPSYGYAGGYAGDFDPFSFVFGNNNDETYTDTKVSTTDDAYANAKASLLPDDVAIQQQIANTHLNNLLFQDQLTQSILAQNAYLANRGHGYRRRPGGYGTFAGGSVSVGPNGVHHSTFVYPPNSHSPNVDTRVGGVPSRRGGPGFYGISSAAYSANVNGKHHGGALTTLNNNGKVTSYRTHS